MNVEMKEVSAAIMLQIATGLLVGQKSSRMLRSLGTSTKQLKEDPRAALAAAQRALAGKT